jgi:hypothetical protein
MVADVMLAVAACGKRSRRKRRILRFQCLRTLDCVDWSDVLFKCPLDGCWAEG